MRKLEDPAQRLDNALTLKVTAAERRVLEEQAVVAGMSASAMLRRKLLENQSVVQALPQTNLEVVRYLRCYLRLTNRVESILEVAAVSIAVGKMSPSDYRRLLFGLDRVMAAFRREVGHAA